MVLRINKHCNTLFLGIISMILGACSSTIQTIEKDFQHNLQENVAKIGTIGGMKMGYITKDELREPKYKSQHSQTQKKRSYGALQFSKNNANDPQQGLIFLIQKNKGAYIAETKFHEKKNKNYFFSFGLNYKEKTPQLGLRIEF